MILSLAACGSGGEDSGESKGEKKDSDIKVGFVVSDMSDAFFAHLVQELQDYSEEIGVTFTVTEAPEIGDKITGIENFVEAKCDTIICHVTDSDALKDAALGAEEAGDVYKRQIQVVPLPSPDGKTSQTAAGGQMLGVCSQSENVEAAAEFIFSLSLIHI